MQITIQTIAGTGKQNSDDSIVLKDKVYYESSSGVETEKLSVVSICDGVGGIAGGRKASLFVSESLATAKFYDEDETAIRAFFQRLNNSLLCYAEKNLDEKYMSTTCTALINTSQGLFVAHIGNCRLYRMQGKYLKQLSTDQTMYHLLKSSGVFEENEITNKNEIYACLGGGNQDYSNSLVVKKLGDNYSNETFILTSDGIHDYLSEEVMEKILVESMSDEYALNKIVEKAKACGSKDDCSIVIIRNNKLI
jgi:protein phosphatase